MARYIIRLHKDVDIDAFAADVPNVVKVLRRVRMVVAELDEAQAEALRGDARVAFVRPDTTEGSLSGSGSQTITNEWQLDRIDQRDLPLDSSYTYDCDGTGVTIYILDTGIRATHDEFAGRIGTGYSALDAPNDDPNEDAHGHGTMVAGAAAGTTTGPAKGATIVPVKVTTGSLGGFDDADFADGVNWILTNHDFNTPAVANVSSNWGVDNETVNTAVQDLINAGIVVTVAAMNNSVEVSYHSPAKVHHALTVGGTAADDMWYSSSNYGPTVDILAPAVDMYLPDDGGDSSYIGTVDGTSFAAPLTAGVVAAMLEADSDLTVEEVRTLLLSQATTDAITGVPADTTDRLLYSDVDVASFPDQSGLHAKVDTIVKRDGEGRQNVTLGFRPKALLFWLVGVMADPVTTDTVYDDNHTFLGMATADQQYSAMTSAELGSGGSSRVNRVVSNEAIRVYVGGTLAVRGSVVSFNHDGFSLDWVAIATYDEYQFHIQYLALGGDDLTDAAIVAWQKEGSGSHAITGAGFQPDCVLHYWSRYDDTLGGFADTGYANTSLGVMLADGTQWVMGAHYNSGFNPANNRSVRNDACIVYQNSGIGADNLVGSFVSMDPDGFTVSYDTTSYNDTWCFSLCLKGGKYAAGLLTQPDATGPQEIATPDVLPRAVLLNTTMQPSTDVNDGSKADAYWGMGASDGTTSRFVGLNAPHEDGQRRRQNYSSETAVLVYNSPEFDPIDAVAQMDSLDSGSFTLDWTSTDTTGAQIGYLAIGTEAGDPPPTPTGLTATAIDYDKVLLTWDAVDDGDGDGS